jgi:hypothetical protein
MAVELQFLPAEEEGMVTLHVEQSSLQGGPFTEIQSFPAGTYPNYIHEAVVTNATDPSYWFRIRWEDASGNYTPFSDPVQGGTTSIVAQVMNRVILRDPSVETLIAGQEAEAAVSEYFNVDDPYSVEASKVNPRILSGLTLLTLARAYTVRLITGAGQTARWSAGLISMQSGTTSTQSWDAIDKMVTLANRELQRNYSAVLLLNEITVGGRYQQLKGVDLSRTLIEFA